MAFHFEFDPASHIVLGVLQGDVNDDEIVRYYRAAGLVAQAKTPSGGISDFSDVKSLNISRQTILELARAAPSMPDPSRTRVIVATSPHVFGLLRMFQSFGEETRPTLQVVRSMSEAYAALGIVAPKFEPLNDFRSE